MTNLSFNNITNSDVVSSTNAYINTYGYFVISTQFKALDSAPTQYVTSTYGDTVISDMAMDTDGDLFLSAGWGDGFAIHRVADNGTMTNLYGDGSPVGSYGNYNSLALDKTRGIAYVGTWGTAGIAQIDYSGVKNGGEGSITQLATLTEAGNSLPSDQSGCQYMNGLQIAGDYLYFASYDNSASQQLRWNTQTGSADNITVQNKGNNGSSGGVLYYSSDTDRIYNLHYTNGEVWVTINASNSTSHLTDPAKTYLIGINSAGMGYHCRVHGFVEDKDNPNHVWLTGYQHIAKLDITDCLDEVTPGNPEVLKSVVNLYNGPYFLMGGGDRLRFSARHPTHKSDFIRFFPHVSCPIYGGWWDQENNIPVCPVSDTNGYYSDKDVNAYSYQPTPVQVTTDNGTKYWIYSGYAYDGNSFHVYDEDEGLVLFDSSTMTLGTFSFGDDRNVICATVAGLYGNYYQLTDTTIAFYLSNDNGSTWESYTPGEIHTFSSTGYQVQFKINMSGTEIKSPHIGSSNGLSVILFDDVPIAKTGKDTSFKLAGV